MAASEKASQFPRAGSDCGKPYSSQDRKSLEIVRDFYRDVVYAWTKKNMTQKEMEALVLDYREGAPLQEFIDDFEKDVLEASCCQ